MTLCKGGTIHGPRHHYNPDTRQLVAVGLEQPDEDQLGAHPRIVSLVERQVIRQVLNACQGVQTKAAGRLGINRNTLHKKLKEYGFEK